MSKKKFREELKEILTSEDGRTFYINAGFITDAILSLIASRLPKEYCADTYKLLDMLDKSYIKGFNNCLSQIKKELEVDE